MSNAVKGTTPRKLPPRDARIKPNAHYLFGPAARGADQPDADAEELVQFMTTSENGIAYPRDHSGRFFTEELGSLTFEDYLTRNPERLRPGRRFYFYEQTEEGYRLVHTGTMLRPKDVAVLSDARSDAAGSSVPTAPSSPASPVAIPASVQTPSIVLNLPEDHRSPAPRVSLEEIIDQMRDDIRVLRDDNRRLVEQLTSSHAKVIEADQKRLFAESELQLSRDRYTQELTVLRAEHERAMQTQETLHSKDVEIMTGKAIEEARQALMDNISDDEPEANSLDRLMDFIAPLMQPASELARSWVEGKLHERRMRAQAPSEARDKAPASTGHVANGQQPTSGSQQHEAPTNGQDITVIKDPMMMFQPMNDNE